MGVDLSFLKDENSPEILKALMKIIADRNAHLEKRIAAIEKLEAENRQQVLDINVRYSILRRDYFSHGREKFSNKNEDRPREKAEQEVLIHARSILPAMKAKDVRELPKETCRHTATSAELDEKLHVREPNLSKEFKAEWKELASFTEDSIEVSVVERKYVEVLHQRQKYKAVVTLATGEEKEVIMAATGPEKLLPGSTYGIDFAIQVVTDKYLMHLPLERQRRSMQRLGLRNIEVKTLYNLAWAVGCHLRPIADSIRLEILSKEHGLCVHADETPWPIQGKNDSDGYLWSISNMAGSFYAFEPTRSGKIIQEILGSEFNGVVMSDGYGGYNRLKDPELKLNIKLANCWSHVRRKFFNIYESNPETAPVSAKEFVELIDDLFAVERRAKTFEELKVLRESESAKIISKLHERFTDEIPRCLPKSQLRGAINYTLKLWSGLTLFLLDMSVPLSNNDAERTLRHAVVGRKNYYGSKTINGADLAATLFTVIESCKRVEVEPIAFMKMAVRASSRGENPPTPMQFARALRSQDNAA